MLFSIIEGMGLIILMLSVYRLKATDHAWPAMFMIIIMSFQSFVMRYEFELSYIVPIINLVLFIFLLATVWRVPLVWSTVISITGYLAFGLIQTLIMLFIFGSAEVAKSIEINGYTLQTATGIITSLIGVILYKFGLGFTFDFEKLRLKKEHIIVVGSIALFFLIFAFILYKNQVWLNLIFTSSGMVFLLYYAIRKESGDHD
ncbi:hypothetical protein D3C74_159820 [compost metagenome]